MRIGIVNDSAGRRGAARALAPAPGAPGRLDRAQRRRGASSCAPSRHARPDPDGPDHAGMDGVEATRRIMAEHPCAILIVTASVERQCRAGVRGHGPRRARRRRHAGVRAAPRSCRRGCSRKIETIARLIGENRASQTATSSAARAGPRRRTPPGGDRRLRRRPGRAGRPCSRPAAGFPGRGRHRPARRRAVRRRHGRMAGQQSRCRCASPRRRPPDARRRCCWRAPATT